MAAGAMTSVIGHWTLAIVLALMPSVCRCHTVLHQHTDEAPIAATHGDAHGSACGQRHHHHGSSHHHSHSDAEEADNAPGVLAWMISDHHHEVCHCPPIQACIVPNAHIDESQPDVKVAEMNGTLRHAGQAARHTGDVLPPCERLAPGPRALLRWYCVLIV